jgi:hypothetical protein
LLFCIILRLRISEIQLPASSLLFNSVYNETLSARRASLCYKKKKKITNIEKARYDFRGRANVLLLLQGSG